MKLTGGRARAAEHAAEVAARAGLSANALAQRAGVDPNTVRDFLEGDRWPWTQTRAALERALGLKVGELELIAGGAYAAPPDVDPVEDIIKASRLSLGNQHKLIGIYYDMLEEQERRGAG